MSNFPIVTLLETVLGKGQLKGNDNVAFHCPFCHHHKRKLEINTTTQHWHCWVCNAKGRKLPILFKRLNVDRTKISKLIVLLEDVEYKPKRTTTDTPVVQLPENFKPLWYLNKNSIEYRNAVHYLRKRDINIHDILRYRIGYCQSGEYSGKIVVPSYDANGSLNFFVSRAYYDADFQQHKNPSISKDIIGFELYINWDMPIILVEGVFDAMAIKRNVIPLFGKTIPDILKKRIIEKNVKTIYICLDEDAKKQALETAEYFMSNGIDVYLVDLPEDKDPSELGFEATWDIINNTTILTSDKLMQEKILCRL